MKKLLSTVILVSVSSSLLANVNSESLAKNGELAWVDEQIEAIKPARVGIKNYQIAKLHNPFIYLKPKQTSKSKGGKPSVVSKTAVSTTKQHSVEQTTPVKSYKTLTLEAIINKSALINGKWYKEGQSVRGYKINKVNGNTIYLTKNNKTKVLTTKVKHRSLKFNNN